MVLVIDNYDSFTYNLVQYLGSWGRCVRVVATTPSRDRQDRRAATDHIVISPGPGTPDDGGVSNEVIRRFGPTTPVLGVCLDHLSSVRSMAGWCRARRLMHGKTSSVYHNGHGFVLACPAVHGHALSLAHRREALPEALVVTAFTRDGEVMGLRHREFPVVGVQFHPESILTEHGKRILQNFLSMTV